MTVPSNFRVAHFAQGEPCAALRPTDEHPRTPTRRLWLLLLLLVASLATGCASAVKYAEPTSGDRARVRFVAVAPESSGNVFVRALPVDQCNINQPFIASLAGRYGDHARRTAGMPGGDKIPPEQRTEVFVPVDKPFRFWVQWESVSSAQTGYNTTTTTTTKCGVVAEFDPQRDGLYQVTYRRESGACRLSVEALRSIADGKVSVVPERTARRSAFQCR
jgi:hypothetical protein